MKLFGTSNNNLNPYFIDLHSVHNKLKADQTIYDPNEQCRKNKYCWQIDPNDKWLFWWNMLILCMIFLGVTFMPYGMVFLANDKKKKNADFFTSTLFGIDILIHFITPIPDDEEWNCNMCDIAIHYLTGYFALDFLSIFPLDRISGVSSSKGANSMLKIMRLPKIIKMIKAKKLLKLDKMLKDTWLLMYYR